MAWCLLNRLIIVIAIQMSLVSSSYNDEDSNGESMTMGDKKKFELQEKMRSIKIDCVDLSKVDPEMVLKLKLGIWPNQPHVSLAKFMLCMLSQLNIMSRQGVFKLDEAMKWIPFQDKDEILEKIDKCLYQDKRVPYEKAYFYLKCINEEHPQEFNIF